MSLVQSSSPSLETIAGAHGIGRIDMVENRLVGIKSREIYEAPAAVALHTAHKELQKFVTAPRPRAAHITNPRSEIRRPRLQRPVVHPATREAIDALVAKVQEKVTGVIRLKFFKGDCPRRRPQVAARAL